MKIVEMIGGEHDGRRWEVQDYLSTVRLPVFCDPVYVPDGEEVTPYLNVDEFVIHDRPDVSKMFAWGKINVESD